MLLALFNFIILILGKWLKLYIKFAKKFIIKQVQNKVNFKILYLKIFRYMLKNKGKKMTPDGYGYLNIVIHL